MTSKPTGATDITRRARWAPLVPSLLVAVATLFQLWAWLPELTIRAAELNDHIFHLALIGEANEAWASGANPRDPWIPFWGMGFPVLRYYQNLPHLGVVAAFRLLQESVPLWVVFKASNVVLIAALPGSVYLGARWLGFEPKSAALAGLLVPLVGADPTDRHLLGIEADSFVWMGQGLFSQLAGAVFFMPALGLLHRATLEGRRFFPALLALAATWLSHLILGYIVCFLGLLALARPRAAGQRSHVALRLLAIYAATAVVAAYLLLPGILESAVLWRSVFEDATYWDSYGATGVLARLATGAVLDGPRLPVVTCLAAAGVITTVVRWTHPAAGPHRIALLGLVVATLVWFGRPTWGPLIGLLPMSGSLPLHRWVVAVQIMGILVAAHALSTLWSAIGWRRSGARAAIALTITATLLAPAAYDIAGTARMNRDGRRASEAAIAEEGADAHRLLARFATWNREHPARGYAGTRWDGGLDNRVAGTPLYGWWSSHHIASISYLMHTMGRSSEVEASFDAERRDHFELFDVRWVLAPNRAGLPPFATFIGGNQTVAGGVVPTAGRFAVVHADAFVSTNGADSAAVLEASQDYVASSLHGRGEFVRVGWQAGDEPRPNERALPLDRLVEAFDPAARPAPGRVLEWEHHDGVYEVRVEADASAHLLARMTFHPGWQVTLDGAPVETDMLLPSFIGVRLGPGRHTLRLAYSPGGWSTVWWYIGLLTLLGVAAADRARVWRSDERVAPSHGRLAVDLAFVVVVAALLVALTS